MSFLFCEEIYRHDGRKLLMVFFVLYFNLKDVWFNCIVHNSTIAVRVVKFGSYHLMVTRGSISPMETKPHINLPSSLVCATSREPLCITPFSHLIVYIVCVAIITCIYGRADVARRLCSSPTASDPGNTLELSQILFEIGSVVSNNS